MRGDFESLGDDERNPRKFIFLAIVVIATILDSSIFVEEFGKLSFQLQSMFFSSLMLPFLAVGGTIAAFAYMAYSGDFKSKILIAILVIGIITSTFFIRQAITFFSVSGFSGQLALGTVYLLFGILASGYLAFTTFFPKIQEPIDSITSEDEEESPLGLKFKYRLLIMVFLVGITIFLIAGTGQGFVQSGNLGTVNFGLLDSPLGSAFTSGFIIGTIETAMFFAILYPFIHGLLFKLTNQPILAAIIGIITITAIFIGFHTTVYKYSESSLVAVGIFGISNAIIAFLTRDNFPNLAWHISNNFLVLLFTITTFSIVVA